MLFILPCIMYFSTTNRLTASDKETVYHIGRRRRSRRNTVIPDFGTSRRNHEGTVQKTLIAIYYLLCLAAVVMTVLEMVRLSVAHLGIGLLPFTPVGILMATVAHALSMRKERLTTVWLVNAAYWICLAAVDSVKIVEEVREVRAKGDSARGLGGLVGRTKYPLGDETTDVGTMIGVYVVLAVLEVFTR